MAGDLRLCALDLDGTLIDSQHHIVAAMTAAFRAEGLPPPSPAMVRPIATLISTPRTPTAPPSR